MSGLNKQREQRQDCDVVFRTASGDQFWAHWFVLAATYTGCHELLLCKGEFHLTQGPSRGLQQPKYEHEARAEEVLVSDLCADMLAVLIDFAYHVPLQGRVGMHNVREVLKMAEALNIKKMRDHCLNVLKENMRTDNVTGIYQLANRKGYNSLASAAFRYIVRNFSEVWENSLEFPSLTLDQLHTVLSSDTLHVSSEVRGTFQAILKWIHADVEARRVHLSSFLTLIRFAPHFTIRDFETLTTHPTVQAEKESLKVLDVLYRTLTSQPVDGDCDVQLPDHSWRRPRVPKDVLFLFGGLVEPVGAVNNDLLSYDCRACQWRKLPGADASPRAQHGVVVLDGLVYFVGGFNGSEAFYSVMCFDPFLQKWTRKANMVHARALVAVALLGGSIYAMGGTNGLNFVRYCERYDAKRNQWYPVPLLNDARAGACAAAVAGAIYV